MKAYQLIVTGVVQGVGFRHYTREEALTLGVSGTVRNLQDGTVEIFVEGKEAQLIKFLDWCHQGPSSAKVTKLVYNPAEVKGLATFDILRL